MEPELKSSAKKYKQVQVLGKGSFGTVYRVQQGVFGKQFAIKQVYGVPMEETREEFNIQFSLSHPNVAKVKEIYRDKETDSLNIVMEYCESDLQKILDDADFCLPASVARRETLSMGLIPQMIQGLAYIHSRNIVHRDIKPGNILLKYDAKSWVPKITDFGMSKVLDRKSNTFSYAGTPIYDAPELWTIDFKKEGYDNRVDIWSLGLVIVQCWFGMNTQALCEAMAFVETAKGRDPVLAANILHALKKTLGDAMTDELYSLLLKMLVKRQDRLSSQDLLEHPTVTKFKSKKLALIKHKVLTEATDIPRKKPSFMLVEKLGEGGFGIVFRCQAKGKEFAVKKIPFSITYGTFSILDEFKIQETLLHENVAMVYEVFLDPMDFLNIVMEYCHCDLNQYFAKPERFDHGDVDLRSSIVMSWTVKLLEGLRHVHSNRVIHRDLKPENILLRRVLESEAEVWLPKITDFGLSKFCSAQTMKARSYCGSPFYTAPELWSPVYGKTSEFYGEKVDIWSMGIVFLQMEMNVLGTDLQREIFSKIPGFGAPNQCFDQHFLIKFLMQQSPWKADLEKREDLVALLSCMLTFYDDEDRWTSEKLLTHSTIKHYRDQLQTRPAVYASSKQAGSASSRAPTESQNQSKKVDESVWKLSGGDLDVSPSGDKILKFYEGDCSEIKKLRITGPLLLEIPNEVQRFNKLTNLQIHSCRALRVLPDCLFSITTIKEFNLWENQNLESLPSAFGNLCNLTACHISGNKNMTGYFPDSISGLVNLTRLQLVTTPLLFPDSFSQLKSLSNFSLEGSGYDATAVVSPLPDMIGQLQTLTSLKVLNHNQMSILPESIGNLRNLEELRIVGSKTLTRLPDSLRLLTNLKSLDASSNAALSSLNVDIGSLISLKTFTFHATPWTHLPDSFGHLRNLSELKLYTNPQLVALPQSLGGLVALESFTVEMCKALVTFPDSFAQLAKLTKIKSFTSFPEDAFSFLVNLTSIEIFSCHKLVTLPESLGHCSQLKELKVYRNNSFTKFPDSLGKLQNLATFNFNDNANLKHLPESLGALVQIDTLKIRYCGLVDLPDSIGRMALTKLSILSLNHLEELPDTLNMKKLSTLSIKRCEKIKSLPESLGNLERLTKLNVSNNTNLSQLPESIGRLVNLAEFNYLGTALLESMPASVAKLKKIVTASLDSEIANPEAFPKGLFRFVNLTSLEIKNNVLPSPPPEMSELKVLTTLKIHNCKNVVDLNPIMKLSMLSKLEVVRCGVVTLPQSISSLSNLTSFAITGNQLETLPDTFCSLLRLKEFRASSNYLKELPQDIGALKKLKLDNNELKALPNSFSKLNMLEYLNISFNLFTSIPNYLVELRGCKLFRTVLPKKPNNNNKSIETMKLAVLGPTNVGKSQITCLRFISGSYQEENDPTVEDSYRKQIALKTGKGYLLDILDTAGMEEFSAMRDQYYRSSGAFIFVTCFDLLDLKQFVEQMERVQDRAACELPVVLAISQIDSKVKTDLEEAKTYCEEIGVGYIETSAKLDINVTPLFFELARRYSKKPV